ncbi:MULTISPECIES: hypothetical protein [unclassified Bradyrhizobium]
MTRTLCLAITIAILGAAPAMSQTKEQQARESTGMANSQKQLGGLKKDREISHQIFRAQTRHHYHAMARHT